MRSAIKRAVSKEEALTNLRGHYIRAWEPILVEALSRAAMPREPIFRQAWSRAIAAEHIVSEGRSYRARTPGEWPSWAGATIE